MALLHICNRIKSYWDPPLSLEVVHFNHGIRPESAAELEFVSSWAARYSLPINCHVWTDQPRDSDRPASKGYQEQARQWRRQICLDWVERNKLVSSSGSPPLPPLIATAHQSEDQVETFFLKILRGVHLSRLHPMKPRHDAFIKPLLGVDKQQLQQYLVDLVGPSEHSSDLSDCWREDSSNAQADKYTRNAVRLNVVPPLQQVTACLPARPLPPACLCYNC